MTYNLSKHVCQRNNKILKRLLEEQKTFSIPTPEPTKKAYFIREALEAVCHHPEFSHYKELKHCYRIKARKGQVECRWLLGKITPEEMQAPADSKQGEELTQSQIVSPVASELMPSSMQLENIIDLLGIISATVAMGARADELFFPDAILPEEDKFKLYGWAITKDWKYIDHEGAGITLTRRDVDEFLLWEPLDIILESKED